MSDVARLSPLVQESTAEMVARTVRDAIARGLLAPGSQLAEVELARQLGVSRGPLREGLQRLTQEGLVTSYRNRGLFVIEMTPDRVRDMYLARQAVERGAAEHLHATGAATATGEALLQVVGTMASAAARDERESVTDADLAFHETLVRESGSPRLIWMHQTLLTETRMCLNALEPTYGANDDRVAEHRAIAEALRDGQAPLTDRLVVAHMRDGIRRLVHDTDGIEGVKGVD